MGEFHPDNGVKAGGITSRAPVPGQPGEETMGFTFLQNEMIDHLCLIGRQVMRVNTVGLDFPEGGGVQHVALQLFVLGKQRGAGQQQDHPQPTSHAVNSLTAGSPDAAYCCAPLMNRGYPSDKVPLKPEVR
jgi:hypothetical protein